MNKCKDVKLLSLYMMGWVDKNKIKLLGHV
jgi:hypothetical protein